MAALYVYGIVPAQGEPLDLPPGVGGGRTVLQRDRATGVAAIVSVLTGPLEHMRRRDLEAHELVLRAALDQRDPVLPLRFGSVYDDGRELERRLLTPASGELARLLDGYAGLVEFELRALYPDEQALLRAIVRERPELARLREEARRNGYAAQLALGEATLGAYRQRCADDQAFLVDNLAPFVSDWRIREELQERVAAQISFLVERRRRRQFEQAIEGLARSDLRLRLTGPLPPYSFLALEQLPALGGD